MRYETLIQDLAEELRDAVGDHYDNGKAVDPCILWHDAGMPEAIDWRGVATTLLTYFAISRQGGDFDRTSTSSLQRKSPQSEQISASHAVVELPAPDPGRDDSWLDGEIHLTNDASSGTPILIEQDPGSVVCVSVDYARQIAAALLAAIAKIEARQAPEAGTGEA